MSILSKALADTWPAKSLEVCGPFLLRRSTGGGNRVNAACLLEDISISERDVDNANKRMRENGQVPLYQVETSQTDLDGKLENQGFEVCSPTAMMQLQLNDTPFSQIQTKSEWPPTPSTLKLWNNGDVSAARVEIIKRAATKKTAITIHKSGEPVGTVFVAKTGNAAMFHAMYVAPNARRLGVASQLIAASCDWARTHGADKMLLLVVKANSAALNCYGNFGFTNIGGYHYRRHPKNET